MKFDFEKMDGLIPVVVQEASTREVLMVGFMNDEALERTVREGRVTFFSRTKQRLWQKGETSGNFLDVVEMRPDCDEDTLLILARSIGPICHTGLRSCFGENFFGPGFILSLEQLIYSRKAERPVGSYTTSLFNEGVNQIIAKVREEAEEVAMAAERETRERLIEESADLLFHWMVLLAEKNIRLKEVMACLERRNQGLVRRHQ